jgi:hypothetical protein
MQLVGFNPQQVRQGVCWCGAATRQRDLNPGPICPVTPGNNIVKCNLREVETLFNGAIRAVAKAEVFSKRVTGIADGTDMETTERYAGCGQATRKRRIEDKWGKVHEIEITAYGWKVLLLIEAVTKMQLAVTVGQIQKHEALGARALVTQARMRLAGEAPLAKVIFDKGFLDGLILLWSLDQQGIRFVEPAKANMVVSAGARALAAAGEGVTVGYRVHTVRQGQGAWTERLEIEVVGVTGLTGDEQYGTEEYGGHHNRRDFEPNLIYSVVVRQWHGKDHGPGGKTVFLTNAAVQQPLKPFDDNDDRSLIENCRIKQAKQQWNLGHPPRKPRVVRVHILFTLLMIALATAYRLQRERANIGKEPVGWQRWRRQLLAQGRDHIIVFTQNSYGIFHIAECSLLLG